ncbi:uncharacterized protein LOC141901033 isoform X2 [Tubulanus polymorphus]|uniref:uncharacterized protein LOC141901033 isoform X2 n=1 Tax=Tubulanus polymorphus TaxID=672921 RepID=UPI003DA38CC5
MDVSTSEETVILIDSQDSHQNIEDNSGNTAVAAAATAGTATSVEQPQYVTLQLEDGTETLGQVVHVSEDGQATVTFVQEINAPPGELNISQEQQPIADTSLKTFDEKTSTPVLDVYPPYSVVEPKEVNFPEDEEENFEGSPLHKVPEKRTPGGAVIIRAEDLDLDSNDVGNTDIDQHTTTQIVRQAVKTYRDGDTEFSKTYLRDYQSLINLVQKCKEPQCGCHKYHCPMCDVQRFKPAFMHKLTRHLKVHWENRISYKDGGILRCSRSCIEDLRGVIHYHCPECPRLFKKRKNIVIHLVRVHEAPPSILRSQSQDEPTKTTTKSPAGNSTGLLSNPISFGNENGRGGKSAKVSSVPSAKVVSNPKIVIGEDGIARIVSLGSSSSNAIVKNLNTLEASASGSSIIEKKGSYLLLPVPKKSGNSKQQLTNLSVPLHGEFGLESVISSEGDLSSETELSLPRKRKLSEKDSSDFAAKLICKESMIDEAEDLLNAVSDENSGATFENIKSNINDILADSGLDDITTDMLYDAIEKPINTLNKRIQSLEKNLNIAVERLKKIEHQ